MREDSQHIELSYFSHENVKPLKLFAYCELLDGFISMIPSPTVNEILAPPAPERACINRAVIPPSSRGASPGYEFLISPRRKTFASISPLKPGARATSSVPPANCNEAPSPCQLRTGIVTFTAPR